MMTRNVKRTALVLPITTSTDLKAMAAAKHTTVTELIRRYIRLGLYVDSKPDAQFIERRNGTDKEIILL